MSPKVSSNDVGTQLRLKLEFRESDVSPGKIRVKQDKGSLTIWALYAYFSDSQNAAF